MIIPITDDFALEKIRNSGQCFRCEVFNSTYMFVIKLDPIARLKCILKDIPTMSRADRLHFNKLFCFSDDIKILVMQHFLFFSCEQIKLLS